ncbi:MAG: helix-turn-helix transcriptional regulator [Syntrophobacteraceae bacterium]
MELMPRASKTLSGTLGTEHDMRDMITGLIDSLESQKAVAAMLGVSGAYLSEMLHGKKGVGSATARKLGWEKVAIFIRK